MIDLSPGQKAFLTACWAASLAYTLAVLGFERAKRAVGR